MSGVSCQACYVTTFFLKPLKKDKRQGNEISYAGLCLQNIFTLEPVSFLLQETRAMLCLCNALLFIAVLVLDSYIAGYEMKYEILICYWKHEVSGSPLGGKGYARGKGKQDSSLQQKAFP